MSVRNTIVAATACAIPGGATADIRFPVVDGDAMMAVLRPSREGR